MANCWLSKGWKAKRNMRHLCYHHSSWLKADKFWWLTATQRYCNGHCICRRGKPKETSKQRIKTTDTAKLTEQHQTTTTPFSFPLLAQWPRVPNRRGRLLRIVPSSAAAFESPWPTESTPDGSHLSCDHTNFKQTNHLWRSNMTGRTQFKQDDDWGC